MPHITTIVDPPVFLQAVRARLARFDGERCVFGRARARFDQPATNDAVAILSVKRDESARAESALRAYREELRSGSDPSKLRVLSWQFGFSSAKSDAELERAARDRVELAAQNHEHTYSSREEILCTLSADSERAPQCEALAQREHDRGRWLHAQAWRAAARWLGSDALPSHWSNRDDEDPRPQRARSQPSPTFREQPWRQRHWLAWDAKNYGITDVPTLLLASDDESFCVRARAYRSLGQVGHCAAVFALREALRDPHPFARAQAARSLGWLGDAGAVAPLLVRARRDGDDEVRRASSDALARIVALWEFWGEWPAILSSDTKTRDVAAKLRLIGAFGAVDLPRDDAPSCGKPSQRIAGTRYEYNAYFDDAQREHDAQRNAANDRAKLPSRIDDALERNDTRALAALCAAVSMLDATECEPRLRALSTHTESAIAFHAARALRIMRRAPSII